MATCRSATPAKRLFFAHLLLPRRSPPPLLLLLLVLCSKCDLSRAYPRMRSFCGSLPRASNSTAVVSFLSASAGASIPGRHRIAAVIISSVSPARARVASFVRRRSLSFATRSHGHVSRMRANAWVAAQMNIYGFPLSLLSRRDLEKFAVC